VYALSEKVDDVVNRVAAELQLKANAQTVLKQ
jgi:hypothetical protein